MSADFPKSVLVRIVASPPSLPASDPTRQALDRLRLAVRVQELAGLDEVPVLGRRPWLARAAQSLLAWADRRGLGDAALPAGRAARLYATLTVGLCAASGALRRLRWRTLAAHVRGRVQAHAGSSRLVAGYVTSSPKEDQAMRVALLLRAMGRLTAGLDLLVARTDSGLPSGQSRRMLSAWLEQGGEPAAAASLEPAGEAPGVPGRAAHESARLRYGVVMTAPGNPEAFRASVRSLLASDYHGAIVVVEGERDCGAYRTFCESVGVTCVHGDGTGPGTGPARGIRALGPDVDVVLWSRGDVLWPPEWFGHLDGVWDAAWDGGRVGLLNLGYLGFDAAFDSMLTQLFVGQRYDDLEWLLRAIREVPAICEQVRDVQARPGEAPFGLGRTPEADRIMNLRQQTGAVSVVASFPLGLWRDLRPDSEVAPDLQILRYCVDRRRWAFFVNTPPVIHLERDRAAAAVPDASAEAFRREYGWDREHFLNVLLSESTVVHRDAILDGANAGRFSDIDFVFDDFSTRLAERVLDNCELVWCRSRAACPYA
jgi:hypothetical protein